MKIDNKQQIMNILNSDESYDEKVCLLVESLDIIPLTKWVIACADSVLHLCDVNSLDFYNLLNKSREYNSIDSKDLRDNVLRKVKSFEYAATSVIRAEEMSYCRDKLYCARGAIFYSIDAVCIATNDLNKKKQQDLTLKLLHDIINYKNL